jgi:hypothetical protein
MLVYKQLWTVERTFRTTKSLLETRPIYHKLDETIRGHVACTFLALVLGAGRPPRRHPRFLARRDRRPGLAHRDRGRAGRQAIPAALRPAPGSQPRAHRPRRRPAADLAPDRTPLINSTSL